MPQRQIPYSGYKSLRQLPNLMFEENGSERDEQSRAAIIGEYTSKCPDFWDKPCNSTVKSLPYANQKNGTMAWAAMGPKGLF